MNATLSARRRLDEAEQEHGRLQDPDARKLAEKLGVDCEGEKIEVALRIQRASERYECLREMFKGMDMAGG